MEEKLFQSIECQIFILHNCNLPGSHWVLHTMGYSNHPTSHAGIGPNLESLKCSFLDDLP